MRLFDDIVRDYEGPAGYAEPRFTYLNRSARPTASRVRQVLEDWFSRYPSESQPDLRGRFRSADDSPHCSAFFELFLHELLLRLGCHVKVHPEISGTTRHPEFLVESPSGSRFYIEAVVATSESKEKTAARARMNVVYDALNRLDSPDFFIGMYLSGAPETPPRARRIRAFLAERLRSLNPDEIARILESGGIDAVPHWHYQHEGWNIDFFPIPKSAGVRGCPGVRPIGYHFHEPCWVNPKAAIRDVIVKKAGRYGDITLPYVVAVNALGEYVDRDDIMDALFGERQITIRLPQARDRRARDIEPKMTRALNGVWTSESGPRYTRVSAVLMTVRLSPWNLPRADICLYHNPYCQRAYTSELTCLPQAVPEDDYMEWHDGESLSAIFNLPLGWPEV